MVLPVVQVLIDDASDKTITGVWEFDRDGGGILIVPAGPTFPTSPAPEAGEIFWRTDESSLYRRNDANTAWESVMSPVSAHAPTHQPGGSDPLPTAAPVTVGTVNQEGSSNSFSRSDHRHNHGNLPGGPLHADATIGGSGFMPAAAVVKLNGIEAGADVTDPTNVDAAGAILHADIPEADGILRKVGSESYEAVKVNWSASVDPTANDDVTQGFRPGSRWLNLTGQREFACFDATAGAAVWKETTGGAGASSIGSLLEAYLTNGNKVVTGGAFVDVPGTVLAPFTPVPGEIVDVHVMAVTTQDSRVQIDVAHNNSGSFQRLGQNRGLSYAEHIEAFQELAINFSLSVALPNPVPTTFKMQFSEVGPGSGVLQATTARTPLIFQVRRQFP